MIPRIMKVIGALTIAMAGIAFVSIYKASASGLWTPAEPLFIASFMYNGVIIFVSGLVIGISTFLGKKWTWSGNVVFQIITIAVIIAIARWEQSRLEVAFVYLTTPYAIFAFIFNLIQTPLSLLLSVITLFMLAKPGTKSIYGNMGNTKR